MEEETNTASEEDVRLQQQKENMSLDELQCRIGDGGESPENGGSNTRGQQEGGSDSGVEVNGGAANERTPVASCDSSLISYCCCSSEELINQTVQSVHDEREACDGTSEGGSESSSVTSSNTRSCVSRRKVVTDARLSRINQCSTTPKNRTNVKDRSLSRTPTSRASPLTTKNGGSTKTTPYTILSRSQSVRGTSDLKSSCSPKTPNTNKSRTPLASTPEDCSRWPTSVINRNSPSMMKLIKSDKKSSLMTSSMGPVETKSSTLDKYATLPRRRRKSAENLLSPTTPETRTNTRSPSLNRAASLRKQKQLETHSTLTNSKTVPPFPKKQRTKTRIYHEISVQTSLTGDDVQSALSGAPLQDVHTRVDTNAVSVQADLRMEIVEKLETEIKELQLKFRKLTEEKENLNRVEDELKTERDLRLQQEERLKMLLNGKSEGDDVIACIEKEKNFMNDVCKKQQVEIGHLHGLCCSLKKELDKSLLNQRKILEQQQESEVESLEMQEFLQAEKSTLADTLLELETELAESKKALETTNSELSKQKEECTHLVRICEQRRQENMSLETRLRAMEACSKDSMLIHGAAVSRASVALTDLGTRLEVLVNDLVTSYHISPTDLEDIVFHNEAFSISNSASTTSSSGENSPPQPIKEKSSHGFLAAIMNAIRAATHRTTPDTFSSEADLLSAEPEPSAFHGDITGNSSPGTGKRHSIASLPSLSDLSPTKYSHRASISTCDDLDLLDEPAVSSEGAIANSESLQNLSDAIMRRQREEEDAKDMVVRPLPSSGIVDQIIEVDNLVTKLLKVLRLIQISKEKERDKADEQNASAEQVMENLQKEIELLKEKLDCNEKSSVQVESLQTMLKEKEKKLEDIETKHELTQELLTNNWHAAMQEVRRQYDAIDAALERLQSIESDVKQSAVLDTLQRELEETNFRAATTLPISSLQPDLNANDATNNIPTTRTTINGTA